MGGHFKDAELYLTGSIPKIKLQGTEDDAKNLSIRENAGSIDIYNETSATVEASFTTTELLFLSRFVTAPNTEILAATKTLVVTDSLIQFLDPGGAGRQINLPAEASSDRLMFFLVNAADADEVLTVKDDGGTTILLIDQNEIGFTICDGTSWKGGRIIKG